MLALQRESLLYSLNYTLTGVTSKRCSAIFAVLLGPIAGIACFKVAASSESHTSVYVLPLVVPSANILKKISS